MPEPAGPEPAEPLAPCPICGRPAEPAVRPFCSRRCAQVDLGRWLTGAYSIPAAAEDEPDRETSEDGA